MNKQISVGELVRRERRRVKRLVARNKYRKERKQTEETHTSISNNVGNYFRCTLKTGVMPCNKRGITFYQLPAGIKGIVLKLPPTKIQDVKVLGIEKGAGFTTTKNIFRVVQRYKFYVTNGQPISTLEELESCKHYKIKLGEMAVNFERDRVVFPSLK